MSRRQKVRRTQRSADQDGNGSTIYIRDVAYVRDGISAANQHRAGGRSRSVLKSILKSGTTSTLDIISSVKGKTSADPGGLPVQDQRRIFCGPIPIRARLDQRRDSRGSDRGAADGTDDSAVPGSWRSTLIIAVSIPLSVLASLIVLSALGETINIMTLGGLALAVGILVDDATVDDRKYPPKYRSGQGNHPGHSGRCVANRGAGAGFHAFDLHRFRADVFPFGRREVSVRAAGGGGGVRDAGFLPAVADAGADDGEISAGCADGEEHGARSPEESRIRSCACR